ncbi:S-adenosyl-L-methionine-dependent methyltransferase [Venturia nashicola]|uniref:S-adenosyl-L-methionine-dependent methyltransferase n=1 Tax=Venturia nashicola TaxID=86259 RepID=A0A4Z1PLI1_9PEZI|nr:S-adenosyl-L-methionine-dependent methyltransferase [Venturia nashicola]
MASAPTTGLTWTAPIADPDDTPGSSDGDSALGSYASTQSASLSEGAYAFKEEHGRRYHAELTRAQYHLPNDEPELNRLDLQHHLFRITLEGSLHRAPLPKDIHHVLDVGTGTGVWSIDFADEYPSATVIGTDLSPVQPHYVPPNCRFYIEDAEAEWTFEERFDYIHGRMLIVGIKDWAKFFEQSFEHLKPGGWIELQDLSFPARCDDGSATPSSPLMLWSSNMVSAAANLGLDLEVSNSFSSLLIAAGFVDIHSETHVWPLGNWPRDKNMKEMGRWAQQNYLQGLSGFTLAYFTRGLGWQKPQVEDLVERVQEQALDKRSHVYIPITVFWARKPESHS